MATFVLFSSLLTTFSVQSADICHSNQYDALRAKEISHPWIYYIAQKTEYDEAFPVFSSSNGELDAYHAISTYITDTVFLGVVGVTNEIRTIYGTDATLSHYLTIKSQLSTDTAVDSVKPTNCDATCWSNVKTQLVLEATYCETTINSIEDATTGFSKFYDIAKEQYKSVVNEVQQALEWSPSNVQVAVDDSGTDALSSAMTVFNAFAGLFTLGVEDMAVQVAVWAISATQDIGGSLVDGFNDGLTFTITVNLNNKLWSTASQYQTKIDKVFSDAKSAILSDSKEIRKNWGKLKKFHACMVLANADKTAKGVDWPMAYSAASAQSYDYMKLSAYAVLMPAKYVFWAQFSCQNNMDGNPCNCEHLNHNLKEGINPVCNSESAPTVARMRVRNIDSGSIVGFIGASGDEDGSSAISKDAVDTFNTLLSNTGSEYSLRSILDQIDLSKATEDSLGITSFEVKISSTLSFSFEAKMTSGWCEYYCYIYGDSSNGYYCAGEFPPMSRSCKACKHCDTRCGYSCGSCLSSETTVLMADNEYKAISDIVAGDSAMNPLDGSAQTVQIVATPLRNRRELYSINGLNFRFTKAHPLKSFNNTVMAMDKEELLFYVPTYAEENVQSMKVNESLFVFSDDTTSSLIIEAITSSEYDISTDDDGEVLYDLVFDLTEPSAYVINGGVVVMNEWYDFKAFPNTTYVLLAVLDALVKAEEHILHQLGQKKDKNRESINDISTLMDENKQTFWNVITDHIAVDIGLNTTTCDDFALDASNAEAIDSLYNDDMWAVRKTIEAFIAKVSPKLNYVFHSEDYEHSDEICFEGIAPLLIDELVSEITNALAGIEVEEISTTETPETTQGIVDATETTSEVETDSSVTHSIIFSVGTIIFAIFYI